MIRKSLSPACIAVTAVEAQDLELLRLPVNRSHSAVVPELGEGSIYTGQYSIAYGFRPSLDVSMVIPFLTDSAGGFNKYGSGDPVLRIAVVDFAGFEEYHAGRRLVDKIRTRLESHDWRSSI